MSEVGWGECVYAFFQWNLQYGFDVLNCFSWCIEWGEDVTDSGESWETAGHPWKR